MQLKEILKDPVAACAQQWSDTDIATLKLAQAQALISELDVLKPDLKAAKESKQECARHFGKVKAEGGDIDSIKPQMQTCSAELDRLEARRKQLEAELLALFTDDIPKAPALPQQFGSHHRDAPGPIRIAEITPGERELWDLYVDQHPLASLYHQYRWRDVVARSFGHASIYLMARNASGSICGVLPLVRLRSRLFGDFAVSMPFFNYGGPLADNPVIQAALLARAAELARARGVGHIEASATRVLGDERTRRTDKVSMIRTIPDSEEALDAELGAKVRAQIKRRQQEIPVVAIGHLDLLDDFYRVFSINMRDLGTPVYAKDFFRNILKAAP